MSKPRMKIRWLGLLATCLLAGTNLLFAPPPNDPVISNIPDQRSFPGVPTRAIPFVIGDANTVASQLTVSATTGNATILPFTNIIFGGSGSNRTVTLTPTTNGFGSALVTVTVRNNNNRTASDTFTLTSAGISADQSFPGLNDAALVWGDYDADGWLDLIALGYTASTNSTRLYHNNAGVLAQVASPFPNLERGDAAWGDYDGDGDLDLLLAGYTWIYGPVTHVFRNDAGTFVNINAGLAGIDRGSVAWVDIDNDGDQDISLVGNGVWGYGVNSVYRNDSGIFTGVPTQMPGLYYAQGRWADADNDGDRDLVASGMLVDGTSVNALIRNDGSWQFTVGTNLFSANQWGSVAWGDYDNDNKPDLGFGGGEFSSHYTMLLHNDAPSQFSPATAGFPGIRYSRVTWADFDNDGRLDFAFMGRIAPSDNSVTCIFRNLGGGQFQLLEVIVRGSHRGDMAWADFDNDGDLDYAICGYEVPGIGQFFELSRNNGAMSDTPPSVPPNLAATIVGNSAVFSWSAASDAEQSGGLSYNLRMGTTPGGVSIISPSSHPVTGKRRVVAPGNAGQRLGWTLTNLAAGTYYWSVQAVDHSFEGGAFATEKNFTVTAPALQLQPVSQSVPAGANVQFSASATGTPALRYQWRRNGVALAGATNAVLNLVNAQFVDEGNYSISVSNAFGVAVSSNALLTVHSPPVFTLHPASQSASVSNRVVLSAAVGGSAPLNVQWWFNGSPLANGPRVSGADTATLSINPALAVDSGNYQLVAVNSYGTSNSAVAVLTVNEPECAVAGAGIAAWWRAEGDGLDTARGNFLSFTSITFAPGKVGQAFVFNGVNSSVVAAEATNLNVGAAAGLTFETWIKPNTLAMQALAEWFGLGPHFWISVDKQMPGDGVGNLYVNLVDSSSATHSFTTPSGLILPGQWQHVAMTYDKLSGIASIYHNGVLVTATNLGSFTPRTTSHFYLGYRPVSPFQGTYFGGLMDEPGLFARALNAAEVRALHDAGYAGKCAAPPFILSGPDHVVAAAGEAVTLTTLLAGSPPFVYQWLFNGAPLPGANSASLLMSPAETNQSGNYSVRISNAAGVVTSAVAIVSIGNPPIILTLETNLALLAGANVSFSVSAIGDEPLWYQWSFNGVPLFDDIRRSGVNTPTLSISNLSTSDAGFYRVTVQNNFGWTNPVIADLAVWVPPAFAVQPTGQTVFAGSSVTLAAASTGVPLVTYQWQFNLADLPGRTNATLVITNAQEIHAGNYSVVISNAAGVVVSDVAPLTVTPLPPTFLQQPFSRTVVRGGEVVLAAAVTGSEPLAYQWLRDSLPIPGATDASLAFTNFQAANAGTYALLVTNSAGTNLSPPAVVTVRLPPGFLWARRGGGATTDNALATAFDGNGNLFVAGTTITNSSFDGFTAPGFGGADIFLAKYDPAGRILWLRIGGGTGTDALSGLAVDAAGNVILAGTIAGAANFSGVILTNYGSTDSLLAKYDPAGALLWATNFGGTAADAANSVAVDTAGNIFLTGSYSTSNQFGSLTLTNAGGSDAYLAKCSPAGHALWVRRAGGTGTETGRSVAIAPQGNVYWAGDYGSSVISHGSLVLSNYPGQVSSTTEIFLARYDSAGNVVSAQRAGSSTSDSVRALAVDGAGNAYMYGFFGGTALFGNLSVTASSGQQGGGQQSSAFLVRYDAAGTARWVTTLASTSSLTVGGLVLDAGGNVYLSGGFFSGITIGGTYSGDGKTGIFSGGSNLVSSGSSDIFAAGFSPEGTVLWALKAGSSSTDSSSALAADQSGNLSLAGAFASTATFGHVSQSSVGGSDAIIAKIAAFDAAAGPVLTAQPTNQTITAGANVLFTVGVTAPGPLQFQWRRDGVIIPGATASSLLLSNVVPAQSGDYTVDITTPVGSLSTAPASLTIFAEPDFVWTRRLAGAGNEECLAVASDASGNTYVAGYFTGSTDFGGTNLTSLGGEDGFMAKFDAAQNLLWLRQIAGTNHDRATALALDKTGNVIVAGHFTGTQDFGGTNLVNSGSNDVFVAKYDAAGDLIWAKQGGGTGADFARAISVHTNGDVVVAGSIGASAIFGRADDSDGVPLSFSGGSDIFLARYNASGALLWAWRAGSTSVDQARAVAFDPSGNILLAGTFSGAMLIGNQNLISAGGTDAFMARFNANGIPVWARRAGGGGINDGPLVAANDEATAIVADGSGNVFVAGYFAGVTALGSNLVASVPTNFFDAFLIKYDANGNALWSRTAGGAAADSASTLAVDPAGNVYLGGTFFGPANFYPSILPGIGGADFFVTMYDAAGAVVKIRKGAGAGDDAVQAVAFAGNGDVVVGGFHSGPAIFGEVALPGNGGRDAFVSRLRFFDADAPPIISTPPLSQALGYNRIFTLLPGVVGSGPLSYQWLFNGTPLAGRTNAALALPMTYANAGDYAVVVANSYGSVTSTVATVSVELTPEFPWLVKAGGTGDDQALALALDTATNLYVAGLFSGVATFTNLGSGTNLSLISTGQTDVFVARYRSNGQLDWVRRGGGTGADAARGIAVDSAGNVVVGGGFNGAALFGGVSLVSTGQTDVFLAKYDPAGTVLWARRYGGQFNDQISSLALDGQGNIHVTGHFVVSINLGGIVLTNTSGNSSNYFVAKFDSSGNVLWALTAPAAGFSAGTGIAVDAGTNVIVTGAFQSTINFGPGILSAGGFRSAFLVKYDRNGIVQWARKGAGFSSGAGSSVLADGAGNIYATTEATNSFLGSVVAKFDGAGNQIWTRSSTVSQASGNLVTAALAFDPQGNLVLVGGATGQTTLEGVSLSSQGFAAKYRPDGTPLWVMRLGHWGYGVAFDLGGEAYVAGRFSGTPQFGITTPLTASGNNDAFIGRLGLKVPVTSALLGPQTVATDSGTALYFLTTSGGPVAYQWRFNGANIPGATGSILNLNGVRLTDAGLYSVVVTNPAGSSTSAPIAVNVTPKIYSELIADQLRLTWDGGFTLQAATNPLGPYATVAGAVSPYWLAPVNPPTRFFRLRSEPFTLSLSNLTQGSWQLSGAGIPGYNFVVLGSTNLVNWSPLVTNPSPFVLTDTNRFPVHFYRATLLQ